MICHQPSQQGPSHQGLEEQEVQVPGRQIPATHRRQAPGTGLGFRNGRLAGWGRRWLPHAWTRPFPEEQDQLEGDMPWVISS